MITEIQTKMTPILNLRTNLCNLYFISACPIGCKTYGAIKEEISSGDIQ
jgi:hypothetical protein